MLSVGQNFAEARARIHSALNFPQGCPLPRPWDHYPLGGEPTLDIRLTLEDARGRGGITQEKAAQ